MNAKNQTRDAWYGGGGGGGSDEWDIKTSIINY